MRQERRTVKMLRAMVVLALGAAMVLRPHAAPATSAPSCDLVSPGFSVSYDPTSDFGKSSMGTMSVDCTTNSALTIQVDLSPGRSANYADRTMVQTGGSSVLHYNVLFGATATPFGDGSPGTQHLQTAASPSGGEIFLSQSLRLVIPPHQFAVPGPYGDSLLVTVQF